MIACAGNIYRIFVKIPSRGSDVHGWNSTIRTCDNRVH